MFRVSPSSVGPPGFASERLSAELRHQLPCWGLADPGVNFPHCGYFAAGVEMLEIAIVAVALSCVNNELDVTKFSQDLVRSSMDT